MRDIRTHYGHSSSWINLQEGKYHGNSTKEVRNNTKNSQLSMG